MNEPIALKAYAAFAARYAALVDTKPHNAYYDRPAVLSLLPDIQGKQILDAGCGTGVYSEWLLNHGASVVGVDVSPEMLSHAQQRVGDRCSLHQADLGQPVPFLADQSFDLVISALVLHYIADWSIPFAEFHRVLRPGGLLIFSTGHPQNDMRYSISKNYFEIEKVSMFWRFGGDPIEVPWFRQPLSAITEWLWHAGFVIERLIEPRPTEEFKQADPKEYEQLTHEPGFMCFRARKDAV